MTEAAHTNPGDRRPLARKMLPRFAESTRVSSSVYLTTRNSGATVLAGAVGCKRDTSDRRKAADPMEPGCREPSELGDRCIDHCQYGLGFHVHSLPLAVCDLHRGYVLLGFRLAVAPPPLNVILANSFLTKWAKGRSGRQKQVSGQHQARRDASVALGLLLYLH